MSKSGSDYLVIVALILTLAALTVSVIYVCYVKYQDEAVADSVTCGVINRVEYSAGGRGYSDITSVYLDNGLTLPIDGRIIFTIGDKYEFKINKIGEVLSWKKLS